MKFPPALSGSARGCAIQALTLVEKGQTAQSALAHCLTKSTLCQVDRHLCSELVYGVLRNESRLDFLLYKFLKKPDGLPPKLLYILRIGAYSLLFQERIPAHAAIHSAVSLARSLCGQRLAKLTNAVLRSLQRLGQAVFEPDFYISEAGSHEAGLAVFYSLPLWLLEQWRRDYGTGSMLSLARRSQSRPWTGLRFNPFHHHARSLRRLVQETVGKEHSVLLGENGLAVAPGYLPSEISGKTLGEWYEEGVFSYQSAGSQLVLEKLSCIQWEAPIWDACAGYGGKSAALLESGAALLLASDMSFERLRHLSGLCRRLGLPVPSMMLADAAIAPLDHWPGHIIADVPCSGLGVLGRRPDLRKRSGPEKTQQLISIQRRILTGLGRCMQPGAELAYITCTLDPAENEQAVNHFLERNHCFELLRQWQTDHDHPWLEGMYGALLRKTRM